MSRIFLALQRLKIEAADTIITSDQLVQTDCGGSDGNVIGMLHVKKKHGNQFQSVSAGWDETNCSAHFYMTCRYFGSLLPLSWRPVAFKDSMLIENCTRLQIYAKSIKITRMNVFRIP